MQGSLLAPDPDSDRSDGPKSKGKCPLVFRVPRHQVRRHAFPDQADLGRQTDGGGPARGGRRDSLIHGHVQGRRPEPDHEGHGWTV